MEKTVMIMSGIPGCGKSHFIRKNFSDHNTAIVSADHFFINEDGEYQFDPSKLGEAHATCMHNFLVALRDDVQNVVVDNTNIYEWERRHYIEAARLAGYKVVARHFLCLTLDAARVCAKRNTHGVPEFVVARMAMEHDSRYPGVVEVVEHSIY